jgi:hypothetical protein
MRLPPDPSTISRAIAASTYIVPDSIKEAQAIRAAQAAGTYKETPSPAVVVPRAPTVAEQVRAATARMREYVIPDSIGEAQKARRDSR